MWEFAVVYAFEKHAGQVYYNGDREDPYITHCLRVMGYFTDETLRTVAILHDVLEDTDADLEEIRHLFGEIVSVALDRLTRREGETYMDYIDRVSMNRTACTVKIYDLIENLVYARTVEQKKGLVERYEKALQYLVAVRR